MQFVKISSLLISTFVTIKNLTKKTNISAKMEAAKHLHADFQLTAEQRHDRRRLQVDCTVENHVFDVMKSHVTSPSSV